MCGCSKDCCVNCCDSHYCCGCCWFWIARAIWFPVSIIGLGLLVIILYYGGYVNNNIWNANSVETQCLVINHLPSAMATFCGKHSCCYEEDCNCIQDCSTGTCETECGSCDYSYWKASIRVQYVANEINYTKDSKVIESCYNDYKKYKYNDVISFLNSNYPVNSTVPCYYQADDPNNFKLFRDPVQGYIIATLFFTVLLCLVIVIWIIFDGVRCIKKCKKASKNKAVEIKEKTPT